jgi:serine/threonine protein kinase
METTEEEFIVVGGFQEQLKSLRIQVPETKMPSDVTPHAYYKLESLMFADGINKSVFEAVWTGPEYCDLAKPGDKVIVKRRAQGSQINHEVHMLERLMHKTNPYNDHFCRLIFTHDVVIDGTFFIDLVLEFGGQDLHDYFSELNVSDFSQHAKRVSYFMTKLVMSVIKLHSSRITHNDIKPTNVVVQAQKQNNIKKFGNIERFKLKLIDFECASPCMAAITPGLKFATPSYAHPHIERDLPLSMFHADLWGIGITCFELYTKTPFLQMPIDSPLRAQVKVMMQDKLLTDFEWHKFARINQSICDHVSFSDFVDFVSFICNETRRPMQAHMTLMQHPFLTYWTRS